jgi:hypothetical protein
MVAREESCVALGFGPGGWIDDDDDEAPAVEARLLAVGFGADDISWFWSLLGEKAGLRGFGLTRSRRRNT